MRHGGSDQIEDGFAGAATHRTATLAQCAAHWSVHRRGLQGRRLHQVVGERMPEQDCTGLEGAADIASMQAAAVQLDVGALDTGRACLVAVGRLGAAHADTPLGNGHTVAVLGQARIAARVAAGGHGHVRIAARVAQSECGDDLGIGIDRELRIEGGAKASIGHLHHPRLSQQAGGPITAAETGGLGMGAPLHGLDARVQRHQVERLHEGLYGTCCVVGGEQRSAVLHLGRRVWFGFMARTIRVPKRD